MMTLDVTKPMVWADTKEPVHYVGCTRRGRIVVENAAGGVIVLQNSGEAGVLRVINVPERVQGWGVVGESSIIFTERADAVARARCARARGIVKIDAELEPLE